MKRSGWTRLSNPKHGTLAVHWRHDPSGMEVSHCGHPTANWPYAISAPGDQRLIVCQSGRGFQKLAYAMDAVERLHRGEAFLTADRPARVVPVPTFARRTD